MRGQTTTAVQAGVKSLDQGIKNSAANASAGGMAVGATSLALLSALIAELLSALLADPLLAAGVINSTRVLRVSQTAAARRRRAKAAFGHTHSKRTSGGGA